MAEPADALTIEVCWIGADPPLRIALTVAHGATVAQGLADSGIAARIATLRPPSPGSGVLDALAIAIHGRLAAPTDPLHDGDRIELLPPLTVDPMVARQRRAEHRRRQAGERRWARDRELEPPR